MTSEQRRNIFLVVKEALHNVVKHSAASGVSLTLLWTNEKLEMIIEDIGKGFETGNSLSVGNGLTNMKKRVETLGGSFLLTSEPGKGTMIHFSVSL